MSREGSRQPRMRKKDEETVLLSGQVVLKDDPRLEVCGAIDEVSSLLGVSRSFLKEDDEVSKVLKEIQGHLFVLGSEVSGLGSDKPRPRIGDEQLRRLDELIEEYSEKVPRLRRFLYPGGAPAAAMLHLARAVSRRCERRLVSLSRRFPIDSRAISYANKLSKILFLLARYLNLREGFEEEYWEG